MILRQLAAAATLAASGAPAHSQEEPPLTPRIVPRCDPNDTAEIVVCGRRGEAERFRLPIRTDRFDKTGPVDSVSRERNRLIEEGDSSGTGSCSTVGPSGVHGCFFREVKGRQQQRAE